MTTLPTPPPEPSPARREWTSISVWFFSGIAAVVLLIAAVATYRGGVGSWLGLAAGAALIIVGEFLGAKYPITAKALDAAGIGVLYAAIYALHARGGLPLLAAFAAMVAVTAAAVWLATRRDSLFIAVLGILGGFFTAYMLASEGDYPLPVFLYLLALTAGLAALAVRKGWWLLIALATVLTAVYEWRWAMQALTPGNFRLVALIFAAFAVIGTVPLWHGRRDYPREYRWIAIAAAHLPLLFALFAASRPNYAPYSNVLFAFLLVVDALLLGIAWRGGPRWLHSVGGVATLLVFAVWFRDSFVPDNAFLYDAWPALLLWAVLFIALYLIQVTPFAGLMFGIFAGMAWKLTERSLATGVSDHWAPIVLTMFIMVGVVFVVAIKWKKPLVVAIAIGMASIALMMMHPPLWTLVVLHAILFAELFLVAWISEQHWLALVAIPFLAAMVARTYMPAAWSQYSATTLLMIVALPYLLFVAYPLVLGARAKKSVAPYLAAALASVLLFVIARSAGVGGWAALVIMVLMALLLWRALKLDPREPRVTLTFALLLAASDVAIASLFSVPWTVTLFALAVPLLIWMYLRLHHALLKWWAVWLTVFVFLSLAFRGHLFNVIWHAGDRAVPVYIAVYLVCGGAMLIAAILIRYDNPLLQRVFSVAFLFEYWFLINLLIANCFHSTNGAAVFDFAASRQVESMIYTMAWATVATALLIFGFRLRWPAARGAAVSLLLAAILKAFFVDLLHLSGGPLVSSLVVLGLSLAVVGIVLQRPWIGRKSCGLDLPVRWPMHYRYQ